MYILILYLTVKRGLDKKNRDGWRPGVAPEGYLNDKATESGNRKILVDPERFPYIKKVFELFHAGTSVREIHRLAKDDWHYRTRQKKRLGGKPLTIGMIYWTLTNPFYMGKYEYPLKSGKWHEGSHESVISEEIFNEIQVMLGRRSPYQLKHHNYPYSSLIKCGVCQSMACAQEKWQVICTVCKLKFASKNRDRCTNCQTLIENMDKPTRLHHIYYRCGKKKKVDPGCEEKSLRSDRLEEQVREKLSQIELSPKFLNWAIEQIAKIDKDENDFKKEKQEGLQRARDDCRKRLGNLLQLKIAPANSDGSLLSDEEYKAQKETLDAEIKSIDKQIGTTDERDKLAEIEMAKALTFAALAKRKFEEKNYKIKRDIFKGLSGLNLNLREGIVNFDSPKYLEIIGEMKKDVDEVEKGVEPSNLPVKSIQTEAYYASIPTVLRG